MNDPRRADAPTPPDLSPEAAPGRAPADVAREQFVHGLLGFLHHDTPAAQARRVAGAMRAIDDEAAEHARRARMTIRRPAWRVASGLAAAAAVGLAVFLSIPTAPAVATLIDSSLAASRDATLRRYEVRVAGPGSTEPGREPIATIDSLGPDRMVVRATTPRGDRLAFGRDAQGDWNLVPSRGGDGPAVERIGAAARRPSWIDFGESTIMMESMDLALERLKGEYDARKLDPARLDPGDPRTFNRISATLRVKNATSPERLELWIDPATRLVERLEMHWAPRPRPDFRDTRPDHEGREGRDGRGPREGDRDALRRRPDGSEGMPPGPDDARPPFRGPRGDGPPRDGPTHDGPPPPRDGPPPPRDGAPRDRHDGPGGRPGFGPGPGPGPGPGSGSGFGGGPGRGPRPMHGPPDFAKQPPPPRVMVITRAEVQPVTEDWFSPAAHETWASEPRGQ
ncbi:MAG: hypothetical protein JNK35_11985 [Phycisphaerae bacterium]|nr:hypothetical protein [Phycisphaerae bacterium]